LIRINSSREPGKNLFQWKKYLCEPGYEYYGAFGGPRMYELIAGFRMRKFPMISYFAKECTSLRLIIIILILINVTFSAIWSHYAFGSKVDADDFDFGNPLEDLCPGFGFRDIEKNGIVDEMDPVYLNMHQNGYISLNDIRITPFSVFPAGSKVTKTDPDIDASLSKLSNWSFAYADLDEDNAYGLDDPVYLHNRSLGGKIAPKDIRLTGFMQFVPGSRVAASNADAGKSIFDLMEVVGDENKNNIAKIRFFNYNGNYKIDGKPEYDEPDPLYLDIYMSGKGRSIKYPVEMVVANDVRLSG
jgi:hypothetical protein